MADTKIIHEFDSDELGIRAYVAVVDKGFSVAIKDIDAGEFFPVSKIYPTEEWAVREAKKAVAIND